MRPLGWLVAATAVAPLLAYGNALILARTLRPAQFALFNALFEVMALAGVSLQFIQWIIAKLVAEYAAGGVDAVDGLARRWAPWIVSASAVVAACAVLIALSLRHDGSPVELVAIALLGITVIAGGPLVFEIGALQGLARYRSLAVLIVLQGLIRAAVGIPLLAVGAGYVGGLMAASAAIVVTAVLGGLLLRDQLGVRLSGLQRLRSVATESRVVASTAGLLLAQAVFFELDGVLAPAVLGGTQAGTFAGILTTTKFLRFAPMVATYLLVQQTSRAQARGQPSRPILLIAIGFVVAADVPLTAILAAAPMGIVNLFVGPQYLIPPDALVVYAVATLVQSILLMFVMWFVGRGRTDVVWALVAAIVLEALAAFFTETAGDLAAVVLLISIVATIAAVVLSVFESDRTRQERVHG